MGIGRLVVVPLADSAGTFLQNMSACVGLPFVGCLAVGRASVGLAVVGCGVEFFFSFFMELEIAL
jgi:hypothetical protein